MPDDLRSRVSALMPQVKSELAELVAIKSVADLRQFPPERVRGAAQWVLDKFGRGRLHAAAARTDTPDGSKAVYGERPRSRGRADRPAVRPLRRAAAAGRGRLDQPPFELTERDGRWYGRGAADCKGNILMHLTALRALGDDRPGQPQGRSWRVRRSRAPAAWSGTSRSTRTCCGPTRSWSCDTGNAAVGAARRVTVSLRGMANVVVTVETLGGRCTRACSAAPPPTRWPR